MLRSPLFTRTRIAWEKREPTIPPVLVLRRFLQVSVRKDTKYHYGSGMPLVASQGGEGTEGLVR